MKKIALIIGRFQPIHSGHLKLIERYYKAGFSIKIGIGSANKDIEKNNPLTGTERKKIIQQTLNETGILRSKIFLIPDIKEDKKYLAHVRNIVGHFDTIITGNPWVLKVFLTNNKSHAWNIESFEEESGRPGGNVTSGLIRKRWLIKPSRYGLAPYTYSFLKEIDFTKRLIGLQKNIKPLPVPRQKRTAA